MCVGAVRRVIAFRTLLVSALLCPIGSTCINGQLSQRTMPLDPAFIVVAEMVDAARKSVAVVLFFVARPAPDGMTELNDRV